MLSIIDVQHPQVQENVPLAAQGFREPVPDLTGSVLVDQLVVVVSPEPNEIQATAIRIRGVKLVKAGGRDVYGTRQDGPVAKDGPPLIAPRLKLTDQRGHFQRLFFAELGHVPISMTTKPDYGRGELTACDHCAHPRGVAKSWAGRGRRSATGLQLRNDQIQLFGLGRHAFSLRKAC
jgi:hypothetical protein